MLFTVPCYESFWCNPVKFVFIACNGTTTMISITLSFLCEILNEMSTIIHKYFYMCSLNFNAHFWKKKYVIHIYVFKIQGAYYTIFLLLSTDKISNMFTIVCPRLLFLSHFDEFYREYTYLLEKYNWNQYKGGNPRFLH